MTTRVKHGLPALFAALLATAAATAQQELVVERLQLDTGARKPRHTVVPVYPEKARRARVEGDVEVCFRVDRQGRTRDIAVRHSSNRVFEKPARDAVRASTYVPLPEDQELTGIKTCRTFRFFLVPDTATRDED